MRLLESMPNAIEDSASNPPGNWRKEKARVTAGTKDDFCLFVSFP